MITVFGKSACTQCTATTREMERKGIEYTYVDLTEDSTALDKVTSLGYKQAPVVIAGNDHWAGFRPDKITALQATT